MAKGRVRVVAAVVVVAMQLVDAEAEVADVHVMVPAASELVVAGKAGLLAALIVFGCLPTWPGLRQDAEDDGFDTVADKLLEEEDVAFGPARQLEHYRMAGWAHKHR